MAINELSVVLYQDHKRNTATAYVKFSKVKDQIYMGFSLNHESDDGYIKSTSSKSKLSRHYIDGISSAISFCNDGRIHFTLYINEETIYLFLQPTDDYPITHQGHWGRKQDFNNWLETAS
jgi:hypothetical protein